MLTEKEVLERAFRALAELAGKGAEHDSLTGEEESYALRGSMPARLSPCRFRDHMALPRIRCFAHSERRRYWRSGLPSCKMGRSAALLNNPA
jgi:hypothetical protein